MGKSSLFTFQIYIPLKLEYGLTFKYTYMVQNFTLTKLGKSKQWKFLINSFDLNS